MTATDKDDGANAAIAYSLVDDQSGKFAINSGTGALDADALDFDDAAIPRLYNLQVVATDGGTAPKATTVQVRVNTQGLLEKDG